MPRICSRMQRMGVLCDEVIHEDEAVGDMLEICGESGS